MYAQDNNSLPVWFILSPAYHHISINSQPFLVGIVSAIQVNKLKKLNHVMDEEYQITHILASLPREYSSVVEQVKIDRRTGSTLITMDEIKKRLKERYLQLKREHGWSEDEMALNMKSGSNQNKNIKKGNKG